MTAEQLSARERRVLAMTVFHHIRTGEPAGSRLVARQIDLDLSPATIRNTMADLEEKGFLRQTHVSSGRVPTDLGYRFYVDEVVSEKPSNPQGVEAIRENFRGRRGATGEIIRDTSRMLSAVSKQLGLIMPPQLLNERIEHLEFRRVAERKVLAIFVTASRLVQTRLLETEEDLVQEDLDAMGRVWNERFSSLTVREVRARLHEILAAEKAEFDTIVERAIALGERAIAGADGDEELYLDGAANILDLPELAQPGRLRALVQAIEEKGRLCRLLDQCLAGEGVRVHIGGELLLAGLEGLSLVTATYRREDQVLGVLGVIGPTRMEYGRIIPIVEYTASTLSACLSLD